MDSLLKKIKKCKICENHLPLEPRPVLQFSKTSRIMIIGQAPGTKAHKSETPWNDPSGDRLREWLGIDRETFYDVSKIAIVPMGFCYPGRGKSGDNPPRPECSEKWMGPILKHLTEVRLKIVIGSYATQYFLKSGSGLVERLRDYKQGSDGIILLPHPSPRNNLLLRRHPWIEGEMIPVVREQVARALTQLEVDSAIL